MPTPHQHPKGFVGVHVRLDPASHEALRTEAMRRLQAGEAERMDVSCVVRDLVAAWREGRLA
ncbi:MAG: hypothetical protein RJA59_414 [Pseudomonadota bacterium]|jgi:hypothetical protein